MRVREIIIIAGLVLSLVLVGVIGVLNAMLDPTDNTDPKIREEDAAFQTLATELMADALANMDGDGRLSVRLDEQDVNRLLYSARGKLSAGPLSARSIYIEKQNDRYRLCIPVKLGGFETLISGEVELVSEGKIITAVVSDITVGRLGLDSPIVSMLDVKKLIVSALNQRNIGCYFDGCDLVIKISRESIGAILADELKNDPNAGLINAMYSLLMLRSRAVEIEIADPFSISLICDLSVFGGSNEGGFSGVNDYAESLLEDGRIDRAKINLAAKYYINGYNRLTDGEREQLDDILSDDPDRTSYGGLVERNKLSLVSILLHQLDSSGGSLGSDYGFKISDSDINDMLSDLDAVGMVWQYANGDGTECGYIAVGGIYSSITDDRISIFVDLDINGYIITVSADFETGESPIASISGSLRQITLGGITLDEAETDGVCDFLATYLKADWISTDRETRSLTIDLTSSFEENIILAMILSTSKHIVTSCKQSAITDGGFILIAFKIF